MQRYKGNKIWENEDFVVAKTESGNTYLTLFTKERKKWWYPYIKVEFCIMSEGNYINVLQGRRGFVSRKEEISESLIELLERNNIDPNNREYMINQLSK